MPTLRSKGWLLAGLLVVTFLAATFALNHRRVIWAEQYDDSYITYRYAANLATGKGLVFNSYEKVNSASSFLYTIVLAAAYRLGCRHLELFGAVFGLLMGSIVVAVTFLMLRKATGRQWEAFLFTLPLCIAGSIWGWAVSGMETILFTSLVVTFLHLYLFADAPKSLSFALLGLVLLCRFEGLLLFAVVAGREVVAARHSRTTRDLGLLGLLAAAPFLALLGFDIAYYGSAIPHAVYVKRVSVYYAPGLSTQLGVLLRFYLAHYLGYMLLAGIATVAALSPFFRPTGAGLRSPLPFLAVYLAFSGASFLLGPFSDRQRYTVHALPVLAVLALVGWLRIRRPGHRGSIASVAVVLVLLAGALGDGLSMAGALRISAEHQSARRRMGEWLDQNTHPGDVIASIDLGQIAYRARGRDFVDASGLTSAGFAELAQTSPNQIPALFALRRPAYLADTAFRTADAGDDIGPRTSTELILARPSTAFRNVDPDLSTSPGVIFARSPVVSLHAGGRDFMIATIQWP